MSGVLDNKMSILHVDDSEDFREIFSLMFGESLDIQSAEDGNEALKILEVAYFDAVVTDFDMPGMNGLELLQQIMDGYPDLPVILYTGEGNEKIAREAFVSGAADYFTKNLTEFAHKEKMINSVMKAVRNRRVVERVRKTEEKFKTVFQKLPVGIVINGLDGTILDINSSALKTIGQKRENLIGACCADYICSGSHETCSILKGGKVVDKNECTISDSFGKKIPIVKSAMLIEFGEEMAVLEAFLDMSEARKVEAALEENRARLSSLTSELEIGTLIIKDQKVTFANDVIIGKLGYPIREMLTWRKKEFLKIIHPEDRYEITKLIEQRLEESDYATPWHEVRILTSEGSEKWFKVQAKKISYRSEAAIEIVAIDITSLKQDVSGKKLHEMTPLELIKLPLREINTPGKVEKSAAYPGRQL